jgi:CubicO group peptidase (beta-lactamase class C family)
MISELDLSVHQAMEDSRSDINAVGLIIGVYKNGISTFYGYGESILGNQSPPNEFSYFEIGSISKTFTAIAIQKMLTDLDKSIETPIKDFLPKDLPLIQRNGVALNFKHLLTHTSGFPFMPDNMGLSIYMGDIGGAFEKYSREKLFTCLANMDLEADPFTRFKYSNLGYGVLGTILELQYEKDYSDVIKQAILDPLGMMETSANFSDTEESRWTKPYAKGKETNYWKDFNALAGAGELKSTGYDMMKYLKANIYLSEHDLGEVIKATHQLTFEEKVNSSNYDFAPALGWFHYEHHDIDGEKFLFHNGGTGGYNTDLFINKEHESGVLIMYNTVGATEGRKGLTRSLLEIISDK